MIDALPVTGKVLKLSMNPGGTHVTNWWNGRESRETVMDFLKAIDFLPQKEDENVTYEETLSTVPYKKPAKKEEVKLEVQEEKSKPATFWERFFQNREKDPPDFFS